MLEHNIRKLTVVKHNHLTKASYYLPVDERRLVLSAISLINPKEDMPDEIKITADFFAKLWGLNKKNAYKQLKEAKKNLYDRSIRLKKLNDKNRYATWDIRWVDAVAYEDEEGYVILSFSKKITPYLTNLKKYYTSHRLHEIRRFKSGHAIRLYELCMQYKDNGWYSAKVQQLREEFGVINKYPQWGEFKRNVLDIAVAEVNKSSIFNIEMESIKRGRKIDKVNFFFGEKSQSDKVLLNQLDMFKN